MQVALGALRPEERAEVLRCCTARMPLAPGVQVEAVAARLRGYVAADVAAVAAEAALLCAVEAVRAAEAAGRHVPSAVEEPGFLESLRVSSAHFEAAVERLGPAVLRGLAPEVPAVRWDDIGGLQVGRLGGQLHGGWVDGTGWRPVPASPPREHARITAGCTACRRCPLSPPSSLSCAPRLTG